MLDGLTEIWRRIGPREVARSSVFPSLWGEIVDAETMKKIVEAMRVFDRTVIGNHIGPYLLDRKPESTRRNGGATIINREWVFERRQDLGQVTRYLTLVNDYGAQGVIGTRSAVRLEYVQNDNNQTCVRFTGGFLNTNGSYDIALDRTPRKSSESSQRAELMIREYSSVLKIGSVKPQRARK